MDGESLRQAVGAIGPLALAIGFLAGPYLQLQSRGPRRHSCIPCLSHANPATRPGDQVGYGIRCRDAPRSCGNRCHRRLRWTLDRTGRWPLVGPCHRPRAHLAGAAVARLAATSVAASCASRDPTGRTGWRSALRSGLFRCRVSCLHTGADSPYRRGRGVRLTCPGSTPPFGLRLGSCRSGGGRGMGCRLDQGSPCTDYLPPRFRNRWWRGPYCLRRLYAKRSFFLAAGARNMKPPR